MPEVTLDLGNQYIGSAYSPQVAITETETGHEIEFTFADSEHPGQLKTEGFEVPNYVSEEAEREAAEAERAAAESARVAAEEGRMNRELDRVFNENARINAEELREDAETARAAAEQARAAAETARASAEGSRASAEQARTSAESARASAEAGRTTAESARVSAEQARATAENARASAEAARESAEATRQTNTAAAITRADAATAAANTATTNADAATTAAQAATGEAETATDAANAAAALATAAAETVTDAYFPMFTAGAAEGITGGGPTDTAAWTYRACPGTDGPATIESIHGNTVVESGELLSVQMEGIETVGFNQWDEVAEDGYISDTTGENIGSNTAYLRSKGYIPVFPNTEYHFTRTTGSAAGKVYYYDADKAFLSFENVWFNVSNMTTPANARYMRFWLNYPGSYNHDICINLSGPRNGEYEPYWKSERTIPATDLRSAGTVYDELTATERITRVGERAYQSGDESDPTVTTDGTTTHYPLTSPTVTPIDPPLNLTYKAAAGGTERITHTNPTAAPTLVVTYGSTADGIRDRALACIAPVENGKASANYGIGSYLIHAGQLCRVTTAIAAGEAIVIGTNVTATTVMAEVLSLVQ